jgi:aspartyl-tRNA synthetase
MTPHHHEAESSLTTTMRTHTCGELRNNNVGKEATLCGWVQVRRDHGGVIFIDLRDRFGITQIVFEPGHNAQTHATANELRREDCVRVRGHVRARKEGMANPNLATGQVELFVDHIEILSKSKTPPFEIEDAPANEDLRLTYRYLDLRRPQMQHALTVRHNAILAVREFLSSNGFREIETPMLMKSTPEGARDYVVPSRVHPGKFYALPQSPQMYKQLLMVAGSDRYFQIARCMRDEDLRADRQPEFTQIDVEMSFVDQDDVLAMMEGTIKAMFKGGIGADIATPFPRITYDESMEKYSCDKPDLRFEMFTYTVSDIVAKSDFQVFKTVVEQKGIVKVINPPKDFTRTELDNYIAFCQENGAKGMAWLRVTDRGMDGNIAKYFSPAVQEELVERTGARPGSTLMFLAGSFKQCNDVMMRLRNRLGDDLGLRDPKVFSFCYVVDFPLFEYDEDEKRWTPAHHMFTMPHDNDMHYLESDPGKVRAKCYDMVLNGIEVASGSIRIHRPDIQERVMKTIGFTKEQLVYKFGFFIDAMEYGAPPHGGMAPGVDRLVALMLGGNDIREVIAFPKNKSAASPMDGSPNTVDEKQMHDLHIRVDLVKK